MDRIVIFTIFVVGLPTPNDRIIIPPTPLAMSPTSHVLNQYAVIGRIRHLISISNLSQAEFARRIGVDPSNLSKHLSGRFPVTEGLINRIVADFGVAKPWLHDGAGIPFPRPSHATTVDSDSIEEIEACMPTDTCGIADTMLPVYDIDVTAGTAELSRMLTDDRIVGRVNLPQLNPDDIIVRVSGDSMSPTIQNGGYIAIRPIRDTSIIFWGQIYVVVLDDYRLVKFLRRCHNDESMVVLHSDNAAYDDMEIRRSDIRNLFIVDAILNFDLRC